jgi:hypothetical protein
MRTWTHPGALVLPLFVVLLLGACSDDGGAGDDTTSTTSTTGGIVIATTDTTGAEATSAAEDSGGEEIPATGRILVSSTEITGHAGEALFIFGPNNESEICAAIDSDPWTLSEAALTDRTADSDPCSGSMTDTVFTPGEHAVTASIFTPGSRTPAISTATLVELVDGDVQLQIDGSKLSGTTAGEPGRITVTVSEITGQAGKIFMILGQNNAGSLCAMIDADSWALPTPGALTELPGGGGGPCGEGTPEVAFPAGDTRLTVAVVVPGNSSPEASIDMVVPVNGDITVTIDGGRLSA